MKHFIFCILLLCFISGLASSTAALKTEASSGSYEQAPAARSPNAQPTGEEVFKANCGRCHVPPMSIPQRITGTVIMHMRTRARLSRQDELLLLKYMAP
jgi:hypothetical protein